MDFNHQIPRDPYERLSWVLHYLKLRGSSFAAVARKLGCSRVMVRNAMFMPSLPQEQGIADEIGVPIEQLFAERYDADGRRLPRTNPKKNSRSRVGANGQNGEAT